MWDTLQTMNRSGSEFGNGLQGEVKKREKAETWGEEMISKAGGGGQGE